MQAEPMTLDVFGPDPDAVFMLAAQAGDQAAFENLMRKYYHRLFNFFYRFGVSPDLAEGLSQRTFLRIFRSRASYNPDNQFSVWLYTVAVKTALNSLRRRQSKPFPLNDGPPEQEVVSAVRQAIGQLPENERIAVILKRFENIPYENIGKIMGISVPAVKSLLTLARASLNTRLERFIKTAKQQ